MTDHVPALSRDEFDRLIARALKLEQEGEERIDLDQARAIAAELGVSAFAWDAAVSERDPLIQERDAIADERDTGSIPALPMPLPFDARSLLRKRLVGIAVTGLVTGAVMGLVNPQADWSLLFGGAAIVAGATVAVDGMRRQSMRRTLVDLTAWWGSVTAGIVIGLQNVHGDPIVFGVLSWLGCAAFAYGLRRWVLRAELNSSVVGELPDTSRL